MSDKFDIKKDLSIDGAGIKGVFSTSVLAALDAKIKSLTNAFASNIYISNFLVLRERK